MMLASTVWGAPDDGQGPVDGPDDFDGGEVIDVCDDRAGLSWNADEGRCTCRQDDGWTPVGTHEDGGDLCEPPGDKLPPEPPPPDPNPNPDPIGPGSGNDDIRDKCKVEKEGPYEGEGCATSSLECLNSAAAAQAECENFARIAATHFVYVVGRCYNNKPVPNPNQCLEVTAPGARCPQTIGEFCVDRLLNRSATGVSFGISWIINVGWTWNSSGGAGPSMSYADCNALHSAFTQKCQEAIGNCPADCFVNGDEKGDEGDSSDGTHIVPGNPTASFGTPTNGKVVAP